MSKFPILVVSLTCNLHTCIYIDVSIVLWKNFLKLFLLIESACSFPPSTGSWTDSKYGTIQFSGSTMFMSQTGYGTGATSTNWTCDTASGSRYLARLTIFQSCCYRIYKKKGFYCNYSSYFCGILF